MSKAVMISIQPYYVFLIIARQMGWNIPQEKTIEVRKDYPTSKNWNGTTYIYCSKNQKSFNRIPKQYQPAMSKLLGKVISEFICESITKIIPVIDSTNGNLVNYEEHIKTFCLFDDCLEFEEKEKYLGKKTGYHWEISNLKIYDKSKELSEFKRECPCKDWGDVDNIGCWEGGCDLFDLGECELGLIPITRPPQNWCYCESLEE